MYRYGAKGHFDVLAVHPYTGINSAVAEANRENSFLVGVPRMREIMLSKGDNKPIWLTEFGWHTNLRWGSEWWQTGVSEAKQAQYTGEAIDYMKRWEYVKGGILYEVQDGSSNRYEKEDNFGLLRYDGSEKPAFRSFSSRATSFPSP